MTRKSKIALLSSTILVVIVIASFIFLLVRMDHTGSINTAAIVLCCCAIAVSLLTIALVYWTKVRKEGLEKPLNDLYYNKYEAIKDAVFNSQLPIGVKKEIKNDVLDLLLTAQAAGKTAQEAVGDPMDFSKNII